MEECEGWSSSVLTCNACNREFENESVRNIHYRSEWHRYNLKRKVIGAPGITEELYLARVSALAEEGSKSNAASSTYSCILCGKEYRSSKAHEQHLNSRAHIMKASQSSNDVTTVIKPVTDRVMPMEIENIDDEEEVDLTRCFVCDLSLESIESSMVHMHKQHGFFIPDVEYLKDPRGFLTYVSLKVRRDFMCLYCSDNCHPFQSLEGVRKHMIAKGHCKVRYGDGGDDEEVELEEFFDYSSSYIDVDGKQLVASDDANRNIELGSGGSELVMTKKSARGVSVTTLGSREFLRYYRQKPPPSKTRNVALAISLDSRYRSMGLATVQSKEQIAKRKFFMQKNNRSEVDAMHCKIGMKSNITRTIPKNLSH